MSGSLVSRLAVLLIAALVAFTSAHEAIHDTAVVVSNLNKSVSFYRDGIGLDVLLETDKQGDWRTLFGSDNDTAEVVFLGDSRSQNNQSNGVLALFRFHGATPGPGVSTKHPQTGLFLVSFWVGEEFNATLSRLHALGFGGRPKIATFGSPPASYARVRDPDGTQVLIVSTDHLTTA